MNALGRKAIEARLVAELRAGNARTSAEIRAAIAAELGQCTPAELAGAIQSLRYQGKVAWDRLELSPSMTANEDRQDPVEETAGAKPSAPAVGPEGEGPFSTGCPSSGPDDPENDYPGEVNDEAEQGPQGNGTLPAEGQAGNGAERLRYVEPSLPRRGLAQPGTDPASNQRASAQKPDDDPARSGPARVPPALGRPLPAIAHERATGETRGFVPKHLLVKAGVHAAQTRAAARPVPTPEHEPEIARQIREEVEGTLDRRRRSTSTATVRQPLELKKFGVRDMTFGEGVASLLAENPNDLMAAITRKHAELWRRVLLLGRATDQRPAEALYAALERGLEELEKETLPSANAAAA